MSLAILYDIVCWPHPYYIQHFSIDVFFIEDKRDNCQNFLCCIVYHCFAAWYIHTSCFGLGFVFCASIHPVDETGGIMFWVGCLSVRMYVCSGKGILQQACSQILVLFFCIISSLSSGFVFLWILVFCLLLCFAVKIFSGRQSSIDRLMGGTLNPTRLLHSKCVFVALDCRKLHCWWCLHSMQCRIYLTVRCLSVCLSHR